MADLSLSFELWLDHIPTLYNISFAGSRVPFRFQPTSYICIVIFDSKWVAQQPD